MLQCIAKDTLHTTSHPIAHTGCVISDEEVTSDKRDTSQTAVSKHSRDTGKAVQGSAEAVYSRSAQGAAS